jgi:hypothetical protein
MGQGLKQAAAELPREDPIPQQLFGPIQRNLSAVVEEKIRLLSAHSQAWTPGASR